MDVYWTDGGLWLPADGYAWKITNRCCAQMAQKDVGMLEYTGQVWGFLYIS